MRQGRSSSKAGEEQERGRGGAGVRWGGAGVRQGRRGIERGKGRSEAGEE